MNCLLRIVTVFEGTERVSEFSGEFFRTERGFEVRYRDAADGTVLTFADGVFSMERRGAVDMNAEFTLKKPTEMQIHSGEGTGVIPVRTHSLDVAMRGQLIKVGLSYTLSFGQESTLYRLDITVFPLEVS